MSRPEVLQPIADTSVLTRILILEINMHYAVMHSFSDKCALMH